MGDKLTDKQKMFCKEYLIDLNATQAAIRAGYSEDSAGSIGSENLQKPEIQNEIQRLFDKRGNKLEITAEKVLQELAKLAFVNMEDFITVGNDGYAVVDLSKLTRDQAAAIQEITVDEYQEGKGEQARDVKKVKFKLADKKGSLDLLAKHLKLYTGDGEEVSRPIVIMPTIKTADGKELVFNVGTEPDTTRDAGSPSEAAPSS